MHKTNVYYFFITNTVTRRFEGTNPEDFYRKGLNTIKSIPNAREIGDKTDAWTVNEIVLNLGHNFYIN